MSSPARIRRAAPSRRAVSRALAVVLPLLIVGSARGGTPSAASDRAGLPEPLAAPTGGGLTAEAAPPEPPWASQAAAEDFGPVVDEVVAVVGDAVITRSDLELEARVVLVNAGGVEAAFGPVDGETVASVLDYLVNQTLIVAEAERLEVFEVPPSDVAREVERFLARFADPAARARFLASQDASEERLGAIFRRDLRVERYLDTRVKVTARPAPGDVEAFYEAHRDRFGDRTLDEVREVVSGFLLKQRYQEAVGRLVSTLREAADVRLLAPVPAFPSRHAGVASEGAAMLSDPPR